MSRNFAIFITFKKRLETKGMCLKISYLILNISLKRPEADKDLVYRIMRGIYIHFKLKQGAFPVSS